jgi:hypothetical protein
MVPPRQPSRPDHTAPPRRDEWDDKTNADNLSTRQVIRNTWEKVVVIDKRVGSLERRANDADEHDGKLLAEVSRLGGVNARSAFLATAGAAGAMSYLDTHGYLQKAVAALTGDPTTAGMGLVAMWVLNSVAPRGPRPEGGLALAWWQMRERLAVLSGEGWGGKLKMLGTAPAAKSGDAPARSVPPDGELLERRIVMIDGVETEVLVLSAKDGSA